MPELLKNRLLKSQRNEITEHFIYKKLANSEKKHANKKVLLKISKEELEHYHIFKKYTKRDVNPNKIKIIKYSMISKILGLTFALRLMEKGEKGAQLSYEKLNKKIPESKTILKAEENHEKEILNLLDEEKLKYAGSMVLGLNDALVELIGVLAGLTFAFKNSGLVAIAGLVTGVSAAFSMAASEYLSSRTEEKTSKNPVKSAVYTGMTYLITVILLIFPYLILKNIYHSLIFSLINAVIIIFLFTFYISTAKNYSFKSRFLEMISISSIVALISFGIGLLMKKYLGINI